MVIIREKGVIITLTFKNNFCKIKDKKIMQEFLDILCKTSFTVTYWDTEYKKYIFKATMEKIDTEKYKLLCYTFGILSLTCIFDLNYSYISCILYPEESKVFIGLNDSLLTFHIHMSLPKFKRLFSNTLFDL